MTDNSTTTIERIARVLAGERLSSNAGGSDPSAGALIDARWTEHRGEAIAVLKSLREPPPEIVQTGDGAAWVRAVNAALGSHAGDDHTKNDLGEVAESARHFFRAPS
jgi:hypothetical protein